MAEHGVERFEVLEPFRAWRHVGMRRANPRPGGGGGLAPVREVSNLQVGDEVHLTRLGPFVAGADGAWPALLQPPLPPDGTGHPHRPREHMLALVSIGRAAPMAGPGRPVNHAELLASAQANVLPLATPLQTVLEPSPQHASATALAARCVAILDDAGVRATASGHEGNASGPGRVTVRGGGVEMTIVANAYGYVMVILPPDLASAEHLGKIEGRERRRVVRFPDPATAWTAAGALAEAVFEDVARRLAPAPGPR